MKDETSAATSAAIASLSGLGNKRKAVPPVVDVKEEEVEEEAKPQLLQTRQSSLPVENEPDYDDSLVILDWCKLRICTLITSRITSINDLNNGYLTIVPCR